MFVAVVGLWQIPFYRATDARAVYDIWSGLARDRFSLAGLGKHLATYPFETFGCLLPWSPLLLAFFNPRLRAELGPYRPWLAFLLTALAVTYPSVWLSTGAGALLHAALSLLRAADRHGDRPGDRPPGHASNRAAAGGGLSALGTIAACLALGIPLAAALRLGPLKNLAQPLAFGAGALLVGGLLAALLLLAARPGNRFRPQVAPGPGRADGKFRGGADAEPASRVA